MKIPLVTLENIPFKLDEAELAQYLKISLATADGRSFAEMVRRVQEIGRPKALYGIACVIEQGSDSVRVDDVTFHSRALAKNILLENQVFPFVVTCGTEVDAVAVEPGDFLQMYWLRALKLALLGAGIKYLNEVIQQKYELGQISSMNPGSGEASVWPIEQQQALFTLLGGDVEGQIGVRLTDSFLMVPEASVSGIIFASEGSYHNCQLCQRVNCPGRQSPFDLVLWESLYAEERKI